MDNQHRKITGYRDLTPNEIAMMNDIKAHAAKVGELVENMRASSAALDNRWISIGATDLQKGFMALTRAVAQPSTF